MVRKYILVCEEYDKIVKHAVNKVVFEISKKIDYVLPVMCIKDVTEQELKENNLIIISKASNKTLCTLFMEKNLVELPSLPQAYSVYVGESPYNSEMQAIAIFGFDESGVLYGAMDFANRYIGSEIYSGRKRNLMEKGYFDDVFCDKLPSWNISTAPAIKTRALWTWGHVIYDYKKYFENMVALRLNEVVIWNDVAPINAKDVVDYAHSLGIKVVWGFAWGWGVNCKKIVEAFSAESINELKASIIDKYKKEYANTNADGIYFQSFTELHQDNIDGKCIAELVTKLVNEIGSALLNEYPNLHIQFGLHATSVKNKLEYIKQVDKRINIVWEDCGAFPYHYVVNRIEDFDQTVEFTKQLLSLRGNDEKFGTVLKGLVNLDWVKFKHYDKSFVMGENYEVMSYADIKGRERIWRYIQADWFKNAEYCKKMVEVIAENNDSIVEGLVEDAMFECFIPLPVAIFAELLWNPKQNVQELISEVSKFNCVKLIN